jgi:hypothetical protein
MTLGNMRAIGVRGLNVLCHNCRHEATFSVDDYPDDMEVRSFGRNIVCTNCGMIGADARPNWREQTAWPSLRSL